MSETDPPAAGGTTQQVEALKRRIQERLGAWILEHWTQLASAFAGALTGAFAVYGLFASQVHDAQHASADAKDAATRLESSVALLQGTVSQLVTQRELQAALSRLQELEDWKCYAQQYKTKQPPPGCPRPEQK